MGRVEVMDTGIVSIQTHYDQRAKCQGIPGGTWIPKDKKWQYLLTPVTAQAICQTFSHEISNEDRTKLAAIAERLTLAAEVKAEDISLAIPASKTRPWHHQLVAYNIARHLFALDQDSSFGAGVLLALDMGPQPLDSKILTPYGWTTMGQLKVGDYVIGRNGQPTKIIRIIQHGVKEVFEVTFSDNAKTRCCKDHLWSVISPRDKWQNKKFRTFSLKKLQSYGLRNTGKMNNYWRWFIPMCAPIEYSYVKHVPFDPYLIGALIGDGSLNYGIRFTTSDQEILNQVISLMPSTLRCRHYNQYDYLFTVKRGDSNVLYDYIKSVKLNVRSEYKHIPREYLFASIDERIALLQGLLDTDGSAKHCGIEFSTASKQLAYDFQSLVRSLGGTATMSIKKTSCLDAYRFYVKLPNSIRPFRLERKARKYRYESVPTRSFRTIKSVGPMTVQCIQVDAKDGLYITDDFIVTHNCGKSKVAVDLIANHQSVIKTVLIVCPHSVINVWAGNEDRPGQFEIHCLSEIYDQMAIHPVRGINLEKKTNAAETTRYVALTQGRQFICVINYESAWREPFASWAMKVGFDLVVCDEIHRIKSPSGAASKFFSKLASTCRYRIGLTGTPLPHSPLDIYGQYRFLDPGIFGTNFTKFRSDYAVMGGFQGHQVLEFKNHDKLHDKMFQIAYRVMSKDVFDLPEFQSEIRVCNLSSEERKLYTQMDNEFCVELENGLVTAGNALVKLLRLQEITSGYLDKQLIGESKKKLLADVVEDFDIHEPLIVFARFTNDLRAIKEVVEASGRTYAELSGEHNELSQWQIGNYDVLGVQIKSGREGVDFTRARYSIYYSLGFSLGDYEQSLKRLDRPGQTRSGMAIHLLAENTVDFKVMKALQDHKEVVEAVLNYYLNAPN